MSESKRKIFTGAQKSRVALEAARGTKTIKSDRPGAGVDKSEILKLLACCRLKCPARKYPPKSCEYCA